MLNFLHDPIPITLSNVFTLVTDKKRRYHVTDDEQSLVLKAYEELNGDWEKMVEYMKDNVMRIPGDYMKKLKTNEYYQGAPEKAAKKRLHRIVTENVKKVATGTPVNPPLPQATSSSTATLSSTAALSGTATRSATSVAPAEPAIQFWTMGSSACSFRFSTATRKHFLLSSSIHPKTHWPST